MIVVESSEGNDFDNNLRRMKAELIGNPGHSSEMTLRRLSRTCRKIGIGLIDGLVLTITGYILGFGFSLMSINSIVTLPSLNLWVILIGLICFGLGTFFIWRKMTRGRHATRGKKRNKSKVASSLVFQAYCIVAILGLIIMIGGVFAVGGWLAVVGILVGYAIAICGALFTTYLIIKLPFVLAEGFDRLSTQ